MAELRQHRRYRVELPATLAGDYAGLGIVYNLGAGGCNVVSDLAVKKGSLLSIQLKVSPQATAIVIQSAVVRWTMEMEIGLEFLEVQQTERARLEQFLATQMHLAT